MFLGTGGTCAQNEYIKGFRSSAYQAGGFPYSIADAIETVGKDGVVTVEESQGIGIEKEIVDGLQFDRGYVSPYMVTNAERMEAVYENPLILITDKKISGIQDILKLLEKLARAGHKELVIIAEDVDGEALATLVVDNQLKRFIAHSGPSVRNRARVSVIFLFSFLRSFISDGLNFRSTRSMAGVCFFADG